MTKLALVKAEPAAPVRLTADAFIAELPQRLAALAAEEDSKRRQMLWRDQAVGFVFSYWAKRFGRPRAALDPKRAKLILQRLREADDQVSDLLYALDGARKDPWIMGTDPNSTKAYTGIETILRDRATVERHAERSPRFHAGLDHPMLERWPEAKAVTA